MWIQHKEIHTGHMRFRNCRCCEHNVLPLVCSKHSTSLGETPTQPGEWGFLKPKVLTSAQRHERTINFTSAKEASNFTRLFWYATLVKRLCKSNHRRTKKKGLGDIQTPKREKRFGVKALPATRSHCRSQRGQISTQHFSSQSEPCSERKISSYLTTKNKKQTKQ